MNLDDSTGLSNGLTITNRWDLCVIRNYSLRLFSPVVALADTIYHKTIGRRSSKMH